MKKTDAKLTPETGGFHVLKLTIEGKQFDWAEQYITGSQLKQLAGIPPDKDIYLSLEDPWDDELVSNDEKVNLAREGIEAFYIKKELKFLINHTSFAWKSQYIIGKQVRRLGQIGSEDEIYLEVHGDYEDELITDETVVDLARPGIEHFISVDKQVILLVNTREREWDKEQISFQEVVQLANKQGSAYTVTYSHGPRQNPKGEMSLGDSVFVKNKMVFTVTPTRES